jgi:transposase
MKPYSLDLRERLVAAVERGDASLRELARRFAVSLSCLVRLLQRRRQTGSVAPAPHGGGPKPRLDTDAEARLLELVRQQPDATLAELRDRLGIPCSIMTIWRALRRHRITRKKKTLHAQERDRPDVQKRRRAFEQRLAAVDPERHIFGDETGSNTAMTRPYGRAPVGERVPGAVPGKWRTVTLIASVRLSGVGPALAFPGATDSAAFQTYVEEQLAPQLHAGDVVVWDNLQPHKAAGVVAAIKAVGAEVEPLPAYSPDKTPIEKMFSKVKNWLRSAAARTTEAVYDAMGGALRNIHAQDILGWFQSCGLCATPS